METVSADVEALSKLGESLDSFGGKIADLMRHAANFDLEQAYFERAYRPDVVERTAKVEVQIDRQIEKAITRLANIKEFKRIYAPRTVEGKRVDAIKAASPPSSDAAGD